MMLNNVGMDIFVRTDHDGKIYRVEAIVILDEEANALCAKNPNLSVIATDSEGRIYIAENKPTQY
jgi:hypothetical protein